MPEYTGLKSVLDASLGKYFFMGFRLEEDGDDFAILYHGGERIAIFNQCNLTIPRIHMTCQKHLEKDKQP